MGKDANCHTVVKKEKADNFRIAFFLGRKKNITKNRKLYIYQTIIQSILVYGAEVWQIPTRERNKILSTEMDVLRRSARKSRMERIKNEHIKEIMGVKGKPDIIDIIEKK